MLKKIQFAASISALIMTSATISPAWGQQIVRLVQQNSSACEPIAKVISGDNHYQPLTKLCSQDRVSAANGGRVKIFCYLRGQVLDIPSDIVGKQCLPLSANERRGCTALEGRHCIIPKGPDEENKPTKLTPYGVVINQERPTISWSKSKGATNYIVRFRGNGGIHWEQTVFGETLTYPQQQPALEPGQVYTVDIVAMQGDQVIDGSNAMLLLLPKDKIQQVEDTVSLLKRLQQPLDELAIDMDAVYEANNLLDQSITVLSARAKSGSINPTVYRLLGDRYLIANFPQQANEAYLKAKKLAQKFNNLLELTKAEAGIKIAVGKENNNQ